MFNDKKTISKRSKDGKHNDGSISRGGKEAPTSAVKPLGKTLFEAQLAKEHALAQKKQDDRDKEESDRLIAKDIIALAATERTTYADLRYDSGKVLTKVLYNYDNVREDYTPACPIIYDKNNQPIGYVEAYKSHKKEDTKRGFREATYEVWIPKALWGNGYEIEALTKSMSLNPWSEKEQGFNGVTSTVYVHMDNADFSGDLLANGWKVEHVSEKYRTFVRTDLKRKSLWQSLTNS